MDFLSEDRKEYREEYRKQRTKKLEEQLGKDLDSYLDFNVMDKDQPYLNTHFQCWVISIIAKIMTDLNLSLEQKE